FRVSDECDVADAGRFGTGHPAQRHRALRQPAGFTDARSVGHDIGAARCRRRHRVDAGCGRRDEGCRARPRRALRRRGGFYCEAREVSPAAPREWRVVTFDLWKDCGAFTLTGIAPTAMGGTVFFDRIELLRDLADAATGQAER